MKTKLTTKVFELPPNKRLCNEPYYMGVSGTVNDMIELVDFYSNIDGYSRPPRIRDSSLLFLTKSGRIFYANDPTKWMRVRQKFMAIGSGSQVALGAMEAGVSPRDAVKAAMKVDPFTGMGTKILRWE